MIVLSVIFWRIILFVWAKYIVQVNTFTPTFPYARELLMASQLPSFIWRWGNFDGVHYLSIALNSYTAKFTQTFFPLYPLLIRLVAWIFNDQLMIISGLVVANTAFIFAVLFFYKLLRQDFDERISQKSIYWLLLFPFSFYFGAIYSESLFLLLVILTFYFARKRLWWWSSIWGALAGLTRINGIMLWPSLIFEYWTTLPSAMNIKQKFQNFLKQPVFYLVPMGFLSYMAFLQIKFGDALMFWHAQAAYGAQRSSGVVIFPLVTVWRYLKILFTVNWTSPGFVVAVVEFMSLIFSILILCLAWQKRIRASYLIFSGLIIVLPILSGTLSSFGRYILPVFIIYPMLAQIHSKFWQIVLLIISASLLFYFSSRFLSGWWIA